MSYILDALRKSDQQRQRGAAPTLLTAQAIAAESEPPAFLLYGFAAAVLVGAGMAIGWLRPWQPEQVSPAAGPGAAHPAPVSTGAVIKRDKPAPARTERRATPPKLVTAAPQAMPTPVPEQPAGTLTNGVQEPRVVTMAELPLPIQQEIPRMSISVHAYSPKPQDRMVGINDRLLREGGLLPPGLTLEQITPDGMIFSYKGYRFHRGLHGSGATADAR